MNSKVKFFFLFIILMIPVIIFLVLKGLGTNQFTIPVYYSEGVPEIQQFDCEFPEDEYIINWPADFIPDTPAVIFVGDVEKEKNMIRRISKNRETPSSVYLLSHQEANIDGMSAQVLDSAELKTLLHCTFASDTLNQWILVDSENRIRGYYNRSLEEQDRLLDEISILLSE